MTATFEQLPEECQTALVDYRDWAMGEFARYGKKHGYRRAPVDKGTPEWKAMLLADWERAGSQWPEARERYGWLHKLRNSFGPSWLDTLEVPEQ